MKISVKLTVSFLSIILLMVSLGLFSLYHLNVVAENGNHMYDHQVVPITQLASISRLAENTRVQMLTILNSQDITSINSSIYTAESNIQEIDKLIKDYTDTYMSSDERERFKSFVSNWKQYVSIVNTNVSLAQSEKFDEFIRDKDSFIKASEDIQNLLEINSQKSAHLLDKNKHYFNEVRIAVIIVIVIAVIFSIGIGIMFNKIIVNPIRKIAEQANQVANGNLVIKEIDINSKDEVGKMAQDFNNMISSLKGIIGKVAPSSEQIVLTSHQLAINSDQANQASDQISKSIQEVALNTNNQSYSTNTALNVVAQISSSIGEITTNMNSVAELSIRTASMAEIGNQEVSKAVQQMEFINNKNNALKEIIDSLGKKSNEIGQIVSFINDIATQTNLLALNASIEATRAGEQGQGFAVVAREIRKLSEQSRLSTDRISRLIADIQNESNNAGIAMSNNTETIENGIELVNHTRTSFQSILNAVIDSSQQAQVVSGTIQQINIRIHDLLSLIDNISKTSSQVATNSESVAASIEEQNASMEIIASSLNMLNKMAEELQQAVSTFKIEPLEKIIS